MQPQTEHLLIKKFIIKEKQERYLNFLSKERTRNSYTSVLYHFRDFKWNLLREITGRESASQAILAKLKGSKHISTCYVISANAEIDGLTLSIADAVENVVGQEGTILVFGEAEAIYCEGEAPNRRYISI
jgi:hypothetical protein